MRGPCPGPNRDHRSGAKARQSPFLIVSLVAGYIQADRGAGAGPRATPVVPCVSRRSMNRPIPQAEKTGLDEQVKPGGSRRQPGLVVRLRNNPVGCLNQAIARVRCPSLKKEKIAKHTTVAVMRQLATAQCERRVTLAEA